MFDERHFNTWTEANDLIMLLAQKHNVIILFPLPELGLGQGGLWTLYQALFVQTILKKNKLKIKIFPEGPSDYH